MEKNIFTEIENKINSLNLDETVKEGILKNLLNLKKNKINIMITGATGSGKSSTINALFNVEKAKVGVGSDPETMNIQKYELHNLVLWDSPGLGDGKEKDIAHSKGIIDKLNELDENGNPLIDIVLVILDGGSRDLGTSYELINSVIIKNLGENAKDRILIAINQADVAMKGRYWNHEGNRPEERLIKFLDDKVKSVRNRIREATGIDTEPIYYSAGFKDEDEVQKPYNLAKLLYFIVKNIPVNKRFAIANNVSGNQDMWTENDEIIDYNQKIRRSFQQTAQDITSGVAGGAAAGAAIGSVIPVVGTAVGAIVGSAVGLVCGLFGW